MVVHLRIFYPRPKEDTRGQEENNQRQERTNNSGQEERNYHADKTKPRLQRVTEAINDQIIFCQRLPPDRAGDVHLLAEDLLSQEGVDQGQRPHHAHQGLVHHGGARENGLLGDGGHPADYLL